MTLRHSLAVLAVVCLSVPSAVGVHHALAPTRGGPAAWLAAIGFELVYLSVALLTLTAEIRRHARRVAVSAVITAITLNTIADYARRVPGGLDGWQVFVRSFDGLSLALSVIESLPLAALAYALATLLHRIAEAQPRQDSYPEPVAIQEEQPGVQAIRTACTPPRFACPTCGEPLSQGQYGAAIKHGHCRACKRPGPSSLQQRREGDDRD